MSGPLRSYTLPEIDEMRSLVTERMQPRGSYREKDHLAHVEDVLRTLMANGTSLDELREEKRHRDEIERQRFDRLVRDVNAVVSDIKACPVCGAPKSEHGWGAMTNGYRSYSIIQFDCGGTGYIANDDHVPRPLKLNDAWCGKKKHAMNGVAIHDQVFKRD